MKYRVLVNSGVSISISYTISSRRRDIRCPFSREPVQEVIYVFSSHDSLEHVGFHIGGCPPIPLDRCDFTKDVPAVVTFDDGFRRVMKQVGFLSGNSVVDDTTFRD